jgi:MFS transporter, DHA1 family, multidrug resistance protein
MPDRTPDQTARSGHSALGAPDAPRAMPAGRIVLFLSLLLGLQPVTTDLYLPALPALTQGFGAAMSQAQLTLTALLLAFGLSQLAWGPISDRFGRRPVLLWGMGAYVLAAVGSTLAPSMEALIVWRTVQGAAMGAAVMCARAIVRDLYQPIDGMRIMSKGQTGLGVIACLSAPLGGLLSDWLGWRMALAALSLFGAATLLLLLLRFEETCKTKNPRALVLGVLLQTWRSILGNPTFWAFSALSAASYGALFTFLASSSFIFIAVLKVSKPAYGLWMASSALVYILGTLLCRRLLPRLGIKRTVALAAVLTLSAGTAIGLLAWLEVISVWALMGPIWVFMLAHGVHQPCSQSGAVGPFPLAAGAASAWNGFLMMLAAFATGSWLGGHMDGTVTPLAYGMWFWSVLIALFAWTLVQRHGTPSER